MLGSGDCVFIQTPQNKNVLIDGGDNKYDVLLPYLLDKRVKKIDYMIVSHFDSDHSNGLIKVIKKIKVNNIIISKQCEESQEFIEFMKEVSKKNISIIEAEKGKRIYFDKYVHIDVLYPDKNLKFQDLNNNSIVAKLNYNNFSILFTGDIGIKAEEEILKKYDENVLRSTIIKIAHHGSADSSGISFLKAVKPEIAIIGVRKE
ncbi:MAG: MBL fold metallo-hydrolase [Clostridia bacterium]|nr:MBL fold metallo-hydrolase [Clostridia bacterium]